MSGVDWIVAVTLVWSFCGPVVACFVWGAYKGRVLENLTGGPIIWFCLLSDLAKGKL